MPQQKNSCKRKQRTRRRKRWRRRRGSNGNKHKSTLKAVKGIYNQSKLGYCFTNFLLLPIDVSARKRERVGVSASVCV